MIDALKWGAIIAVASLLATLVVAHVIKVDNAFDKEMITNGYEQVMVPNTYRRVWVKKEAKDER